MKALDVVAKFVLVLCPLISTLADAQSCPIQEVQRGSAIKVPPTQFNPTGWGSDHLGIELGTLGDIDGDGRNDFFGLARQNTAKGDARPRVLVFSGASGVLRYSISSRYGVNDDFGERITPISDIDGDGLNDIVIGTEYLIPFGSATNHIDFFSGKTGLHLFEITPPASVAKLGAQLSIVNDLSGDGHPDVATTGSVKIGTNGTTRALLLFSGVNGSFITSIVLSTSDPDDSLFISEDFGASAVSVGDINSDGISEFVISDSGFSYSSSDPSETPIEDGAVIAFDGKTRQIKWIYADSSSQLVSLGDKLYRVADTTGDGVAEVLVFSTKSIGSSYRLTLLNGKTGALIYSFDEHFRYSGRLPYYAPDFNADGKPDFGLRILRSDGSEGFRIYSLTTGTPLAEIGDSNPFGDERFSELLFLGDLNGDAVSEIVFASPSFSIIQGGQLAAFEAGLIALFSSGPDNNGNGLPDYCEAKPSTPTPTVSPTPTGSGPSAGSTPTSTSNPTGDPSFFAGLGALLPSASKPLTGAGQQQVKKARKAFLAELRRLIKTQGLTSEQNAAFSKALKALSKLNPRDRNSNRTWKQTLNKVRILIGL